MRKTFYYNYILAEDDEEFKPLPKATNPGSLERALVEIRDIFRPPIILAHNPWKVQRRLTYGEISTGRLLLSESETFEHVFRYWALEKCNQVLVGGKVCVVLYDVTDEGKPVVYGPNDNNTALEKGPQAYLLRVDVGMLTARGVHTGVKMSLYWNFNDSAFYLRLFR